MQWTDADFTLPLSVFAWILLRHSENAFVLMSGTE